MTKQRCVTSNEPTHIHDDVDDDNSRIVPVLPIAFYDICYQDDDEHCYWGGNTKNIYVK